jgi:hypothetical protein
MDKRGYKQQESIIHYEANFDSESICSLPLTENTSLNERE